MQEIKNAAKFETDAVSYEKQCKKVEKVLVLPGPRAITFLVIFTPIRLSPLVFV